MTTIDELEWFVVLAECGHMTQAAEELSITQPTLSRALSRLERRMGAPLFDRVHRGLRLNPCGEVLLEHARRGLDELSVARERIALLQDPERGTIRLAFLHSIAVWLAPELLRGFRSEAAAVSFELTQAAGHEIVEHVRAGRVDLGLTAPRPYDDQLTWTPLHREPLCLAVSWNNPLSMHEHLALADVGESPFVGLKSHFGLRRLADDLCARAGVAPRMAFESSEIGTLEGLVAADHGVAVVPLPRPQRAEPGVRYIPLTDDAAYRTIGLLWPPGQGSSPAVRRFVDFVTVWFHREFGRET